MEEVIRSASAIQASDRVCDPLNLRSTFGRFASGVTVVTCADGADAHGMTANSFISVSLEPARALISIKRSTKMHGLLMEQKCFGLSVLGANQASTSSHFAGHGQDGFVPTFERACDVPLIADAIAWMVCRRSQEVPIGDHTLFVGDLIDCDHHLTGEPLLFFGGRYAALAASSPASTHAN